VIMTSTGLIIARQPFLRENESADLPTFFEAVLGPCGKWLSVAANLVILYGLLTAYLAGVASVAANSFGLGIPAWAWLLLYFCAATLLGSFGSGVLRRSNALLMTVMWALFVALLVLVVPHFRRADLAAGDLTFFASGLPILVTAFNFHNVVPTLCRTLNHDRRSITRAIWLGSGIGAFMTLLWTVAVMVTLPMESADGVSIIAAFKAGVPATVPLNQLRGANRTSFRDRSQRQNRGRHDQFVHGHGRGPDRLPQGRGGRAGARQGGHLADDLPASRGHRGPLPGYLS